MATQAFGKELSNREFFVQRWEQEYPAFVRLFKALPADRLDYRPAPKSRSAGELVALQVAAFKACINLCKTRKNLFSWMHWEPPTSMLTLEEMIGECESCHGLLHKCLRELDDEAWNHPAWLVEGDEQILLKDTIGGLLWIALFDLVHHRGQLSTYVRPMGGKVPSIYGPSGDSPAV